MEQQGPPDDPPQMREWRRFVPTLGTLALFVCLFAPTLMAGLSSTSQGVLDPETGYELLSSTQRIGPGYVTITTTYENGLASTETQIGWLTIGLVLCVVFALARSLAWRVELRHSARAARLILVGAPLAVVVLAVLTGGLVSRLYWGYWWDRPGTSAFTHGVERVTHLSFVEAVVDSDGDLRSFVVDEDAGIDAEIAQLAEDPYYALPARLLEPLVRENKIPEDVESFSDDWLASLAQELNGIGEFASAESGYEDFKERLHGVAMYVESDALGGEMIVGLSGGEVSNDHRPHDEYRWDYTSSGVPDSVVHQRFYYDLAGLEGAEWWTIALLLGGGGAVGCTLLAVVAGSRGPRR